MPEPELPELLPAPAPELLPAPELPPDGELVDGELVDGEALLPPALPPAPLLLPLAPLLLLPSSFRHFSRSAPIIPTHLLLDAPDELLLPVALGEDEALSLPDAPADEEPLLCATATLASANSAAAVAVPMTFNI